MSQDADHNKILGIIHLVYGAFNVLVLIVITVFMVGVMGLVAAGQSGGEAIPIGIFGFVMAIVILLNLVFTAPEFVTAYALLKRKRWARVAGIIAAIIESLNFPFGTALCVYTLWFLFSDKGKLLYDKPSSALPPSPRQWQQFQREVQYVPPSAPPDWR